MLHYDPAQILNGLGRSTAIVCLLMKVLEERVHIHLTIRNRVDYNPSAARANCVASYRFTSELEFHLSTEITSVSKYLITAHLYGFSTWINSFISK